MNELNAMREQLEMMLDKNAKMLWRLARTARRKGCSADTVKALHDEGWWCNSNMAYPERLLDWKFPYEHPLLYKMMR